MRIKLLICILLCCLLLKENGIEDAFNYGVKVTGVTVHFVDAELIREKLLIRLQLSSKMVTHLQHWKKKYIRRSTNYTRLRLRKYLMGEFKI